MLNIDWQRLESSLYSFSNNVQDRGIGTQTTTEMRGYRHREGAMIALNPTQEGALEYIRSKYPHNRDEVQSTLDHLNNYLLNSTPLSKKYVHGLSKAEREVYYRDIFHTAYRCLIRTFNPWMLQNTFTRENLRRRYIINFSKEQLETVAAIWKALNDEHFSLGDGYTRENAKALFAETLSDIVRAHNRDNHLREDDMQEDKPSCQHGINQRLVQFIMIALQEDPSAKILTVDVMKQKFQEHFISESQDRRMTVFDKIEQFGLETLTQMKEALDNLITILENTPEEKQLLSQLFPWTTDDLSSFIDKCKAYYGNDRFTGRLNNAICFQEKRFDNFGQLILGLARDPLSAYCEEIKTKLENKIETLSQTITIAPISQSQEMKIASISELEMRRARLVDRMIAENQQDLVYHLLDGSPDFVTQVARESGIFSIEEERQEQITWAIEERNEALVLRLLEGSPNFVRQIARQRQQAAQERAAQHAPDESRKSTSRKRRGDHMDN